jgi:hypothetical protein
MTATCESEGRPHEVSDLESLVSRKGHPSGCERVTEEVKVAMAAFELSVETGL